MLKTLFLSLLFLICPVITECTGISATKNELFSTIKSKNSFAREISFLVGEAWRRWQDAVVIGDVDVEGSHGLLFPGDMKGAVLTASSMLEDFNRKGRSQEYIDCVRAVVKAVENGMRSWQRGYSHTNIPFPQGASCTYTLPPCQNVPVTVGSGSSSGRPKMSEKELYNYMLYRAPAGSADIIVVFRGAARAISECFMEWERSCAIIGIEASGGIAPQPSPMGTGPGPVTNAKGNGGALVGPCIDIDRMYEIMIAYFAESSPSR